MTIILTFDIEDWFQVENLRPVIARSDWPFYQLRVEEHTYRVLDLLDSIFVMYRSAGVHPKIKATFFVLGWIAERLPGLVREIHQRGHEVASHGFDHILNLDFALDVVRQDLDRSKKLLEDISGSSVVGYRSPNFSVSNQILEEIQRNGYLYDSSYNSFAVHGRYGKINGLTDIPGSISKIDQNHMYELLISNLLLGKKVLPWGGGGYFRIMPFTLFWLGVKKILRDQGSYLFYMHPWEIDADQPRISGLTWKHRFRHYINLDSTYGKLSRLLKKLQDHNFLTCYEYLQECGLLEKNLR